MPKRYTKKNSRKQSVISLPKIISGLFTSTITIARWQFNIFGLVCISIGILIGGYIAVDNLLVTRAATSPWTQTDWSGGVGASTTNQYSAGTSIVDSVVGQMTLTNTEKLSNTGFESDLASWSTGEQPDTISGLKMWLKADANAFTDAGITLATDSQTVQQWRDSSSGGNNAIQNTSGSRATYKTNIINGQPVLRFDGLNSQYSIALSSYSLANNSFSLFAVHRPTSGIKYGMLLSSSTASDDEYLDITYPSAGLVSTYMGGGGTIGGTYAFTSGTSLMSSFVGSTSGTPYKNGTAQTSGTTTSTTSTGLILGNWKSGDYHYTGDIAEVILYNAALSSTDRARVENYLSGKYGIAVSSGIAVSRDITVHHTGAASTKIIATNLGEYTQALNVGDTNTYNISAYAYIDGSTAVDATYAELFYNGATISTTYASVGGGWYTLSGTLTGANASRVYGLQVKAGKTVYVDDMSVNGYASSGILTSNIFDTGQSSTWGNLTYTATIPVSTTVAVKVRTGNALDLSDATAFSSCSAVGSGSDLSGGCSPDNKRYVQYQVSLSTTNTTTSPTFQDLSINFAPSDITPPTNPTSVSAHDSLSGSTILTTNAWYNYPAPSFTWSGALDAAGPEGNASGIQGYFVYFGTDATADPVTAGLFQTGTTYTASSLVSGNTYYLRIKTRDVAQNISSSAYADYTYRHDATEPVNPTFVSASPAGYSATNSFSFLWPAATDSLSGLKGYYYKTGATSGSFSTDQFTAQTLITDIPSYQTGANIFYIRSTDNADNTKQGYVQVTYYYNPDAPSQPQNLAVNPTSNTKNLFAFSWAAPATFKGQIAGYRYSVNAKSTVTNTTYTTSTSLAAGPFATQVGENTFYVVAVDDSGNVNYDNPASVIFTAQTAAPPIPIAISITDASNRTEKLYALTVSWKEPDGLPDDFSGYIIERAESSVSASSIKATSDLSYIQIAKVSDTAYTNTGLDPAKQYSYRVKVVDTTSNASAPSMIVSKIPTGKFTDPPAITKGPSIEAKSTSATIVWETDRAGTSLVQCGPTTSYGISAGQLDAVTEHSVAMKGLTPGATYHCRVQTTDVPELVDYSTTEKGFSPDTLFKTLDAPGLTDITVSDISLSSAIVSWKSNVVASSRLVYGTSLSYGSEVTDLSNSQVTNHTVRLKGLTHSTPYHFRIKSTDAEGNLLQSDDYVFETLKMPTASKITMQPVTNQATATMDISWETNVPTTSVVIYHPEEDKTPVETAKAALDTKHKVRITNLLDDTPYILSVSGRDGFGNTVASDQQRFHTATDSRPPVISNVTIETQVQGNAEEAKAQVIVSWNTDEPGSSQVEYGPGLSTDSYPNQTVEDGTLTNSHVVVISELKPAQTYHLRVKTHDRAGNLSVSGDNVVITGRASSSVLNIILQNLQRTFGWLGGLGR